MSGTTANRRHGLAGLLVALFVVAGLAFSYGLGHAPPPRLCTEHAVTVPLDVAAATARHHPPPGPAAAGLASPPKAVPHQAGPDASSAHRQLHGLSAPAQSPDVAKNTPRPLAPGVPGDACLCLAVLLTIAAFGLLAAGRGRGLLRPPARAALRRALFPRGTPSLVSLASLQVLRL